jgi:hypothetical protein
MPELTALFVVAAVSVGGCTHVARKAQTHQAAPSPTSHLVSVAEDPHNGPCISTDHGCLALNPDVSQQTLRETICTPGYTRTVRPGTSYTRGVKAKLAREAGFAASRMSDFELDHIVPLALGRTSSQTVQPGSSALG